MHPLLGLLIFSSSLHWSTWKDIVSTISFDRIWCIIFPLDLLFKTFLFFILAMLSPQLPILCTFGFVPRLLIGVMQICPQCGNMRCGRSGSHWSSSLTHIGHTNSASFGFCSWMRWREISCLYKIIFLLAWWSQLRFWPGRCTVIVSESCALFPSAFLFYPDVCLQKDVSFAQGT